MNSLNFGQTNIGFKYIILKFILFQEKIKKKVFWMGGIYSAVLTDETTHLVSDTVLSDKYVVSRSLFFFYRHNSIFLATVWDGFEMIF